MTKVAGCYHGGFERESYQKDWDSKAMNRKEWEKSKDGQ